MYCEIPAEIKPTETSAKITYANAFDPDLCLLLREIRFVTLENMQDVALEVESNMLAAQQLRGKTERRKGKEEYTPSTGQSRSKLDDLAKTLDSLTSKLVKLEVE